MCGIMNCINYPNTGSKGKIFHQQCQNLQAALQDKFLNIFQAVRLNAATTYSAESDEDYQ